MLKKTIHKVGILSVVVAVSCILIGVIVEFHQVHIYKSNISFWHLQATKTTSKDTKKYITPANSVVINLDWGFDTCEIQQTDASEINLKLSEHSIFARQLFDLITHEYKTENILRGPPAC